MPHCLTVKSWIDTYSTIDFSNLDQGALAKLNSVPIVAEHPKCRQAGASDRSSSGRQAVTVTCGAGGAKTMTKMWISHRRTLAIEWVPGSRAPPR